MSLPYKVKYALLRIAAMPNFSAPVIFLSKGQRNVRVTWHTISSEIKPRHLDDDTEEFLPSQPNEYKMRSLEF